jgi:hypothetical protein
MRTNESNLIRFAQNVKTYVSQAMQTPDIVTIFDLDAPGATKTVRLRQLIGRNVRVDWGDDVIDYTDGKDISHTYELGGRYTCKIYNVTSIGLNAFSACKALVSIEFSDMVTSIGEQAVRNCSNLTNVILGKNITEIVTGAFYNDSLLEKIVIPRSVKKIGGIVFLACSLLTIYCEAANEESLELHDNWNPDGRPVVWGYDPNSNQGQSSDPMLSKLDQLYFAKQLSFNKTVATQWVAIKTVVDYEEDFIEENGEWIYDGPMFDDDDLPLQATVNGSNKNNDTITIKISARDGRLLYTYNITKGNWDSYTTVSLETKLNVTSDGQMIQLDPTSKTCKINKKFCTLSGTYAEPYAEIVLTTDCYSEAGSGVGARYWVERIALRGTEGVQKNMIVKSIESLSKYTFGQKIDGQTIHYPIEQLSSNSGNDIKVPYDEIDETNSIYMKLV